MIKFHSSVLILCSIIGFFGHYFQFGIARLTPWIPAAAGLTIMILDILLKKKKGGIKYLPPLLVLSFGILTTNMAIRFLPLEFEPIRKKIIFSIMSVSAGITLVYYTRDMWKN